MDGHPRQNPAYRPATGKALETGLFLLGLPPGYSSYQLVLDGTLLLHRRAQDTNIGALQPAVLRFVVSLRLEQIDGPDFSLGRYVAQPRDAATCSGAGVAPSTP